METQIKGLVFTKKGARVVNLFAYATNGLPGLEINLGHHSTKTIREKFIFLCKSRRLNMPLKRYVLCAEVDPHKGSEEEIQYLELPLLLLYWHLAGLVPLMNLSHCLAAGMVNSLGQIQQLKLPLEFYEEIEREGQFQEQTKYTLILDQITHELGFLQTLPTLEILSQIEGLTLLPPKQINFLGPVKLCKLVS